MQIHNSSHPSPYIQFVSARLKKLETKIKTGKACKGEQNILHKLVEEISKNILKSMNTKFARRYQRNVTLIRG
ncbi:AHH domain-containing protein [Vibrio lentus]